MKVYASMPPDTTISQVIDHARRVEALGYDGLQISETIHDSLALSLLVAEHTERLTIRTSVTLAFVRSPTLVAYSAWDLARFSGGRFELGLGTQIRQNIEERYAMEWSDPIERMADYLGALRSLFDCFSNGGPIDYRSTNYSITRLQPYFNPGPDPSTAPPVIYLGGVNPRICALAGACADGFITHPTNSSPRYLERSCMAHLAEGRAGSARRDVPFELVVGTQVITGRDEASLAAERERQRHLLAFLYSTPAYRPTLELYGWGDLTEQLKVKVRTGSMEGLDQLITDEVIDTLIPTATFDELPGLLGDRYGSLCQGITVSPPADPADDAVFAEVIAAIQSIETSSFETEEVSKA